MHVTIRGKRWEFLRKRLNGDYCGWCDAPDAPRKKIIVDDRLKGFDELDTILHEIGHAADFDKCEDYVEQVATDMARVLWRLGYRRVCQDS